MILGANLLEFLLLVSGGLAGALVSLSISNAGLLAALQMPFFELFGELLLLLLLVEISLALNKYEKFKIRLAVWSVSLLIGLAAIFIVSIIGARDGIFRFDDVLINDTITAGAMIGLALGAVQRSVRKAAYGFMLGAAGGAAFIWFGEKYVYVYVGFLLGIGFGIADRSPAKTIAGSILGAAGGLFGAGFAALFSGLLNINGIIFFSSAAGISVGIAYAETLTLRLQREKFRFKNTLRFSAVTALVIAIVIFFAVPYGFILVTSLAGALLGARKGIAERSFPKAAYGLLLGAFGGASWIWFGEKNASAYIGLCIGIGIGIAENSLLKTSYFAFLGGLGGFLGMSFADLFSGIKSDAAIFLFPTAGIGIGLTCAQVVITKLQKEKLVDITGILMFTLVVYISLTIPSKLDSASASFAGNIWNAQNKEAQAPALNTAPETTEKTSREIINSTKKVYSKAVTFMATRGASSYGTDLVKASSNGHRRIVELLLTRRAAAREHRDDELYALIKASENGYKDIVELLVANDADINGRRSGVTPLTAASEKGRTEIVEFLLIKGAAPDCEGKTALIYAAENNQKDAAGILLLHGADINKSFLGETPLMSASRCGSNETARYLISKGADIFLADRFGRTAFLYAAEKNRKEIARILLEAGADINKPDRFGQTALMIASQAGHEDFTDFLISKGADMNLKDEQGSTALKYAQEKGFDSIAQKLLAAGAH